MKILSFRKFEKNTLRGFLGVELPSGMILKNLTWHQKGDGERTSEWLGLPAREYTKDDGSKSYVNMVDFVDKQTYWRFVEAVLDALRGYLQEEQNTG